jgi:long-chain fatty acid transport protein
VFRTRQSYRKGHISGFLSRRFVSLTARTVEIGLKAFHCALFTLLFILFSDRAPAAFFQIAENSASGLGNSYAGGTAIAQDASTVWFNPAGITRLQGSQFTAALNLIDPIASFQNAGSTTVLGMPLTGGNGGDFGQSQVIPNFYYTTPINKRLSFGLAVNSPFGLSTDYNSDWVGRYYAIKSQLTTANLNPAIAYKVNDKFSIGGGIDAQYADATLTNAIDFGTICTVSQASGMLPPGTCTAFGQAPQQTDGQAKVKANDYGWGYNLGFLWQPSDSTRVGLAYRSEIKYNLDGNLTISTPNAGTAAFANLIGQVNSGAKADVTFPATVSASVYHDISPRWAIMGDLTQTRWSSLSELRVSFDSGAPDSVTTLDLKNVLRYSIGATYRTRGSWSYRFGTAFDQTPTPNPSVRTARLPDSDRTWLSFGASYRRSDRWSFDFAYTYVSFDQATIDNSASDPNNTFRGNLVGTYNAHVNILSAQLNHRF